MSTDSYSFDPISLVNYTGNYTLITYESKNLIHNTTYRIKNEQSVVVSQSLFRNTSSSEFSCNWISNYTGNATRISSMVANAYGNIYLQGLNTPQNIYRHNLTKSEFKSIPVGGVQYWGGCVDRTNLSLAYFISPGGSTGTVLTLNTGTDAVVSTYTTVSGIYKIIQGPDGYLYGPVADGTYKIYRINPANGNYTLLADITGQISDGAFTGITIDRYDYLYCTTRGNGNLCKFDLSGNYLGIFATCGNSYGDVFDIACDLSTNTFYVSSTSSPFAIFKVGQSGAVSIFTIINTGTNGSYSIFFQQPSKVLYISDTSSNVYYFHTTRTLKFFVPALPANATYRLYDPSNNLVGIPITRQTGISPIVDSSNLIAYYPFDTDLLNYSGGSARPGTSVGTVNSGVFISTIGTKLMNGAAYFLPKNTNYFPGLPTTTTFKIPNITFTTNGITIAFWAKFLGYNGYGARGILFDFGNTSMNKNIFGKYETNNPSTLSLVVLTPSLGSAGSYPSGGVPIDGLWHHYCFTITSTGMSVVYLDGSSTLISTGLYPNTTELTSCLIGYGNSTDACSLMLMNQFVVFNRVLSSTEINTLVTSPSTALIVSEAPGTAPVITASNTHKSVLINITSPSVGGYPLETTYYYSIDGGATYIDAQTLSTSFTIPNLNQGVVNINVKAASKTGSTVNWMSPASNTVSVNVTCFLEGTKILCFNSEKNSEEYRKIETLRKGDLVKTARSGYKAIHSIGHSQLYNPSSENRLFRFSCETCSELFEDLYITGNHCSLIYDVSDEKLEKIRKHMGDVYVTEGDYRVPACLDDRATPYDKEESTIWHFALEHESPYKNYGVYANGLLVESSSIRYLTEIAGMTLVE